MPNYCDLGALEGFTCGQASDPVGKTGVTVLRFDAGAVAAVDVRGAAPGTRETDLLKPHWANVARRLLAVMQRLHPFEAKCSCRPDKHIPSMLH